MAKEIINEINSGTIHITEDVIISIANVEASNTEGVCPLPVNMMERFSNMYANKTVEVNLDDSNVYLTMRVAVEFGKNLVAVASEIQEKVKEKIETMTGLNVVEVNIIVEHVAIPKKDKEQAQ